MSNMDNYNYWGDSRVINSLMGDSTSSYGLTSKDGKIFLSCDEDFFCDEAYALVKINESKFAFVDLQTDKEVVGQIIGLFYEGSREQFVNEDWGIFKDKMAKVIEFLPEDIPFNDDVLSKYECAIPFKSVNCYQCDGKGTMVNPSIDAGGLSSQDFYDDPDFAEGYFSGRYDVTCSACNGSGKQTEMGWDAFASEYIWVDGNRVLNENFGKSPVEVLANYWSDRIDSYHQDMYDMAQEYANERRWGC